MVSYKIFLTLPFETNFLKNVACNFINGRKNLCYAGKPFIVNLPASSRILSSV